MLELKLKFILKSRIRLIHTMINLGMNVLLDWETPMGGDYKLYQPHPPKYQEKKFENHGYKKHLTQF